MSKNILVVGGSSGIGLETVKQLVGQGHKVLVANRSENSDLYNLGVPWIQLDVLNQMIELNEIPSELHGLVYAPGSINLKPFHRFSLNDFQQDFEINVLGAVKVLQNVYKNLKAAKGASVILFSTVAAQTGMSFHSSIATAKAGLEGLARSLAAEWAAQQIRINVIAPSITDTPLAEKLLSTEEKKAASAKRHPLQMYGDPAKMASLAAYLLSDNAEFITGQVLKADGGISATRSL